MVTLKYEEKQYIVPEDGWGEFAWTEGNMSCDCNRSRHIRKHCDKDFPELPCGDRIVLIDK